jgi:hypothetical protein
MDSWIECAWFQCRKRFEPNRRSNQFRHAGGSHHAGALYCSRSCQQKAYRQRHATVTPDDGASVTKTPEGNTPHATVTRPEQHTENIAEFSTKNGHARRLMRTRKGEIVADAKWPGMYRIKWRGGRLSDMVNYTRAADALRQAS